MGWHSAHYSGSLLLTVVQNPGLVVAVAQARLLGMSWNHAVALAVEQQALQERLRLVGRLALPVEPLCQLGLHRIKDVAIQDWFVFPRVMQVMMFYLADQIARTCDPDDIDGALDLLLTTADVRSNFVERIWMTSRRHIAGAVLRAMKSDPWITGFESNFREFMKALNKLGGGIVFEALSDDETDRFVVDCVQYAKMEKAA